MYHRPPFLPTGPLPGPPEAPPPSDPELRRHIDTLAAMVARSGPTVEELARKQVSASALNLFFMRVGEGHGGTQRGPIEEELG